MQEDEGDEDGDTPHALGGGAMLAQRSARQTTEGPESPQLQASPLRAAGSATLASLDADAEVEHFKRIQVCNPCPLFANQSYLERLPAQCLHPLFWEMPVLGFKPAWSRNRLLHILQVEPYVVGKQTVLTDLG